MTDKPVFLSRKKIKERDLNKCRLCGSEDKDLEIHHLTPKSIGGSNYQHNLITLCKPCHYFMHANPMIILKQREKISQKIKKSLEKAENVGKRGKDKKPRKKRSDLVIEK